ncbi:MAG: hypothetical protein ACLFQB_15460 [Chitinispirillaceae bacterium]
MKSFLYLLSLIFSMLVYSPWSLCAETTEQGYVYARPLSEADDQWAQKAAKVLHVELQNHFINNDKLPWRALDYSLDTSLSRWYQTNAADTIHSIPSQFTSKLGSEALVLIYNLFGEETEGTVAPGVYPAAIHLSFLNPGMITPAFFLYLR